jgi:hypothetical protein
MTCAGVDQGDGFDCYGQPVFDAPVVVPYYSPVQKAAVWARLTNGEPLTLTEVAAIRGGLFGQPGIVQLNERGQSLPGVNVTATAPTWLVLAALFFLIRRT